MRCLHDRAAQSQIERLPVRHAFDVQHLNSVIGLHRMMARRAARSGRMQAMSCRKRSSGRVWTALRWQGLSEVSAQRWLVRSCVRPVMRPFHMPLAIMPFARLRSRSKARTRSASAWWVFLSRRFRPALCIHFSPPFPTSKARDFRAYFYAAMAPVTAGSR